MNRDKKRSRPRCKDCHQYGHWHGASGPKVGVELFQIPVGPVPGQREARHNVLVCATCRDRRATKEAAEAEAQRVAREHSEAALRSYEWALEWRGVSNPCSQCGGSGRKTYGSTATWRGGIGGQSMTADVCDKCWGSGGSPEDHHARPGRDLRKQDAYVDGLHRLLKKNRVPFRNQNNDCGTCGHEWHDGVCIKTRVGRSFGSEPCLCDNARPDEAALIAQLGEPLLHLATGNPADNISPGIVDLLKLAVRAYETWKANR